MLIAFDDGDIQLFSYEELALEAQIGSLQPAIEGERGVINNRTGYACGTVLVYSKSSKGTQPPAVFTSAGAGRKPVGVMAGSSSFSMGTCKIYESFTVRPNAFTEPEAGPEVATPGTQRTTRAGKGACTTAQPSHHARGAPAAHPHLHLPLPSPRPRPYLRPT